MRKRILFYLCGDQSKASSRVRGYWIAEALSEKGKRCFLEYCDSSRALLLFLLRIPFYDVVFFQKTYSRWHCLLLRFARLMNKKTIFDLDDAPSRTNHPVTLRNVEFMMRRVSAVTVGSNALFEYARQFSDNVHLIPSSINLKHYQPSDKSDRLDGTVCLGWIGNGRHYKQDLIAVLREPLMEIAKEHGIRFKLIGACGEKELYEAFEGVQGLELDFVDQVDWANPKAVTQSLQDIDIGLYPLLPNKFNKYKCGFKALEYMAMEIPVVSSDVAENREIIDDDVDGYIVNDPEGWKATLRVLIADEIKRKTMGKYGREKVERQYSIQKSAQLIKAIIDDDS